MWKASADEILHFISFISGCLPVRNNSKTVNEKDYATVW